MQTSYPPNPQRSNPLQSGLIINLGIATLNVGLVINFGIVILSAAKDLLSPVLRRHPHNPGAPGPDSRTRVSEPATNSGAPCTRRFHRRLRGHRALRATALLSTLLSLTAPAQTLAHPGWAGSGLTPETWWRHAILYRIDDNKLPTLTQLPSLQAFGIDAIILTPQSLQPAAPIEPTTEPGAPGPAFGTRDLTTTPEALTTPETTPNQPESPLTLDDFLFECSRLRIHVLIPLDLTPPPNTTPAAQRDNLLALARSWLYRGAAGFVLSGLDKLPRTGSDTPAADPNPSAVHLHHASNALHLASSEPTLLTDLHKLLAQTSGDHILVAAPSADPLTMPSLQLRIVSLGPAPSTATTIDPETAQHLATISTPLPPRPLLAFDTPTTPSPLTPIDATLLLAGTEPAILDSSLIPADLLARVFPPLPEVKPPDTPVAAPPPPPPPPPQNVYGSFQPYVHKETNTAADRRRKAAAEKAQTDASNIAFDTFPVQPMYQPISNTPEGYAAFFHRLIQLHRANATLHDGTLQPLTTDAQTVAWIVLHNGTPPIVVLCNPSDTNRRINIRDNVSKLHLNLTSVRTLLHTGPASGTESVDDVAVAAHGVYVGELVHTYTYAH